MSTLETRLYGYACSINSINFMNNLTWNAKINKITQMFKNYRQVKKKIKNNVELKDGPAFDYPQKITTSTN